MPAESSIREHIESLEGLHGVGVSVVNALSEILEIEIRRAGKIYFQRYHRGQPDNELKEIGQAEESGTKVVFTPDSQVFGERAFSFDILSSRLRELAFLNPGLHISIVDEREPEKRHDFFYEGGSFLLLSTSAERKHHYTMR